jgi:rhamnosyltransferase
MDGPRIAASVVLFRPTEGVESNVRSYLEGVERVYVVDNSPRPDPGAWLGLRSDPRVKWTELGRNVGVAAALNLACGEARREGFEWLLTMDQDAAFAPGQLASLLAEFADVPDREAVAVFCPTYNFPIPGLDPQETRYAELDIVLTAFNLLSLEVHRAIGGFDERLFIDEVDHEFCLRARLRGYRIVQATRVLVQHQAGNVARARHRGVAIEYQRHPPERLYTMTRNTLTIGRWYRDAFPEVVRERRSRLIVVIKQALRFGPRRISAAYAVGRGAMDAWLGRFPRPPGSGCDA